MVGNVLEDLGHEHQAALDVERDDGEQGWQVLVGGAPVVVGVNHPPQGSQGRSWWPPRPSLRCP